MLCTGQGRGASARAHVHTRFPYLGNGLADCVKHWCVARAPLPSCITQIRGSVNLHVRTCTPHFHISGTAGQIALNRRLGDRERRSETTGQIALKFCFGLGTNYHLCHLGCVKNCQKRPTPHSSESRFRATGLLHSPILGALGMRRRRAMRRRSRN